MKKFILALCLGLSTLAGRAQNYEADMKAMNNWLMQSAGVHIKMNIVVVNKDGSQSYHELAEVHREGSQFYYSYRKNRMIMNEKHLIMIDDENESVTLKELTKEESKFMQQAIALDDSLFKDPENMTFSKLPSGNKQYSITYKTGYYQKFVVELDALNRLKSMTYVTNESNAGEYLKQEVDFSTTKKVTPESYLTSTYIKNIDGEYELDASLQDYSFTITPNKI